MGQEGRLRLLIRLLYSLPTFPVPGRKPHGHPTTLAISTAPPHFRFFPVHCYHHNPHPRLTLLPSVAWSGVAASVPLRSPRVNCWGSGRQAVFLAFPPVSGWGATSWRNYGEKQRAPRQGGSPKRCDVTPTARRGHALGPAVCGRRAGAPRRPRGGPVLASAEDKPSVFPIVSSGSYFLLFILAFVNQRVKALASESEPPPTPTGHSGGSCDRSSVLGFIYRPGFAL